MKKQIIIALIALFSVNQATLCVPTQQDWFSSKKTGWFSPPKRRLALGMLSILIAGYLLQQQQNKPSIEQHMPPALPTLLTKQPQKTIHLPEVPIVPTHPTRSFQPNNTAPTIETTLNILSQPAPSTRQPSKQHQTPSHWFNKSKHPIPSPLVLKSNKAVIDNALVSTLSTETTPVTPPQRTISISPDQGAQQTPTTSPILSAQSILQYKQDSPIPSPSIVLRSSTPQPTPQSAELGTKLRNHSDSDLVLAKASGHRIENINPSSPIKTPLPDQPRTHTPPTQPLHLESASSGGLTETPTLLDNTNSIETLAIKSDQSAIQPPPIQLKRRITKTIRLPEKSMQSIHSTKRKRTPGSNFVLPKAVHLTNDTNYYLNFSPSREVIKQIIAFQDSMRKTAINNTIDTYLPQNTLHMPFMYLGTVESQKKLKDILGVASYIIKDRFCSIKKEIHFGKLKIIQYPGGPKYLALTPANDDDKNPCNTASIRSTIFQHTNHHTEAIQPHINIAVIKPGESPPLTAEKPDISMPLWGSHLSLTIEEPVEHDKTP